ncbi:hypothetical protein [Mycolicibacterium sarraceniae]|uniref:Uncharacterized protein n=1 Tax=Mycolicibacterium sarraceniae TaxID=1534348 RepID=A0A7I7SJ98_9MYCO|nr:hypothetical protein [Mycolicibacterium sarraceniae]BBY57044.1 hypothetical protein MSAR_01800 [Mycolicibacterium sarraceniae]
MIEDVDPVGALCCLLIAIAALAAVGGYVAGVVRQRRRNHARRYFVLGVVTGFIGAFVVRRPVGRDVMRRLALPQRFDNPLTVAALQLRRGLNSVLPR